MVFAQPYIPVLNSDASNETETVCIYIDNSFSMENENEQGRIIEIARREAIKISEAYSAGTNFLLFTNDLEARHQHLISRDQFRDLVSEINVSPASLSYSNLLKAWKETVRNKAHVSGNVSLYIISDFQKGFLDNYNSDNDSLFNAFFLPIRAEKTKNLTIDSCWFESPYRKFGASEELFVKITNHSNEIFKNVPVELYISDSVRAIAGIDIEPESSGITSVQYVNRTKGHYLCRAEISDYPVTYDNSYYLSYEVADSLNILSIEGNGSNIHFASLFETDPYFNYISTDAGQIDYSTLARYNLIILDEVYEITSGLRDELSSFVENGGNLIIIPSGTINMESYNSLLLKMSSAVLLDKDTSRTRVKDILYSSDVYVDVFRSQDANIDLPFTSILYPVSRGVQSNVSVLLKTENGNSLLSVSYYGEGKCYFFGAPVRDENTNFHKHPLFVPTFINIALNSRPAGKISYTLDKSLNVKIPSSGERNGKSPIHLVSADGAHDIIPATVNIKNALFLSLGSSVKDAGNYFVRVDNKNNSTISFNYNRAESIQQYYSEKDLNDYIQNNLLANYAVSEIRPGEMISSFEHLAKGNRLWRWFLIGALVFLLLEILTIRYFRK